MSQDCTSVALTPDLSCVDAQSQPLNCSSLINCFLRESANCVADLQKSALCRQGQNQYYCDSESPSTSTAAPTPGLSAGATVAIVIVAIIAVAVLVGAGLYGFKYMKDRRRLRGKYNPQEEEDICKQTMPHYIAPPAIEGLI